MATHVAVAVLKNSRGQILIAKRKLESHMGGKWEFPGGKVETGETIQQALSREMREELDVTVQEIKPLIKIHHHYPDKTVLLDVWSLEGYRGTPKGNEGQEVMWRFPAELVSSDFPEANAPIINALKLPDYYFVTPDLKRNSDVQYLQSIQGAIEKGATFIQLRCPQYSDHECLNLLGHVRELCVLENARLILNRDPALVPAAMVDGVHLNSTHLFAYKKRPVPIDKWLSASCHTEEEIQQAKLINVDFISLSPVQKTLSHPEAGVLGWDRFEVLSRLAGLPVYALGGMSHEDLQTAKQYGGRGVAGIRMFLD